MAEVIMNVARDAGALAIEGAALFEDLQFAAQAAE